MDSHGSVNAYFLSKALKDKARVIVNIVQMDHPELLLEHLDADLIISTFQYGFTSRIINKKKQKIYQKIRKGYNGLLCSIIDDNYSRRYYEDVLLRVLPETQNLTKKIFRAIYHKLCNTNLRVVNLGWSADPEECFPKEIANNEFNVFIDHGPYDLNEKDLTDTYIKALVKLKANSSDRVINVYIQNNNGIIELNIDKEYKSELYIRINKVAWPEIISYYQKSHIFCVTHRESAGLAVIESAMCGTKIYVPRELNGKHYISKSLLSQGVNYYSFKIEKNSTSNVSKVLAQLQDDLDSYKDRQSVHDKLRKSNSWQNAANNVIKATINKRI